VKPFTTTAVVLFALIALMQLLRFILGWEVTVNGVIVPIWASLIAFVIAAGLAVMLWRKHAGEPSGLTRRLGSATGRCLPATACRSSAGSPTRDERLAADLARQVEGRLGKTLPLRVANGPRRAEPAPPARPCHREDRAAVSGR
jgi:hypothetical protein